MSTGSSDPPTSRRALIVGAGLGVFAGSAWVAGLRAVATPSQPRLSVIGTGDAQILLLDTTRARVLFILGAPDERLLDRIAVLMSVFRQRIDILIGQHDSLAMLGRDFVGRWNVSLTAPIIVQSPGLPPATNERPITSSTDLDLGDGVSIRVRVTSRDGWLASAAASSLWVAEIEVHGYRVAAAPNAGALRALATPNPALVCVPDGSPTAIGRHLQPASIAINHDSNGLEQGRSNLGQALVRVYPEDTARFDLLERGIVLPMWAETADTN